MKNQCPKCGSKEIKLVNYINIKALVCKSCQYDERNEFEPDSNQRTSQKAKGSYTPYKTGGSRRTK
tara:strand:- start:9 stop:206 length:198 start_codon:yes stop_codon:yes gene_type:complete